MKLRKLLALVIAGAVTFGLLAFNVSAQVLILDAVASGELAKVHNLAEGKATTYFQVANGNRAATFTYEEGKGLTTSTRAANYNSVDFITTNLANGEYKIEVEFAAGGDGDNFFIQGGDSFTTFKTSGEDKNSATLAYDFTVKSGKYNGGNDYKIRLNSSSTKDITVVNVKLYGDKPLPAVADEPAATDEPAAADEPVTVTTVTTPAPVAAPEAAVGGDVFYSTADGDEISGAFIDASKLKKGTAYTLRFNVTLTDENWAGGLRVRWSRIDGWGDWNDDAGNFSYEADGYNVAEGVPAVFTDMEAGKSYTLAVNFVYGEDTRGVDPNECNYIAVVGLSGDHGLVVNRASFVTAGSVNKVLLTAGAAEAPAEPETAAPAAETAPAAQTQTPAAKTGNLPVTAIVSVMALAGAGALVSKKRK